MRYSFGTVVYALVLGLFAIANLTATAQNPAPRSEPNTRKQTRQVIQRPLQPREPFRLTPEQQQRLDQILQVWEQRGAQVKTYRCKFTRWEFDSVWGPKGQAKTISTGSIRYAAPDKGLFRVDAIRHYSAPQDPGEKPQYEKREGEVGEYWQCDGKSVFEFNAERKLLIENLLPPELHGVAIADGPLPFLFGAKADKIKRRYWIRERQTPENVKGQYWLEATPKFRQDAQNYRKVDVVLDEKKFLPVALQVHDPNGKSRTAYQFSDRKANDLVNQFQEFTKSFIRPKTPLGWKKVVEDYRNPVAVEQGAPESRNAQRTTPAINRQ